MKHTITTKVITPTPSSSSFLIKTERPASTQKMEASTTLPYITSNIPLTQTDSRSEISAEYTTSADAPETDHTNDPLLTKITTTTATKTASKVIRGRIPWNRLFGGTKRPNILNGLKRPHIPPKISSTTQVTTVTLTTTPVAMPTTTIKSLAARETLLPSIHTRSKESSLDYEGLASADFELTTLGPSIHHVPTSSPYYPRSSTTAESPPQLQTLPSPPTVKPHLVENPDETLSSGSGGLSDRMFVIKQRPGRIKGQQGRVRRPFQGRRPFRKPGITKANPTTTTGASTAKVTLEATTQSVSLHRPLSTMSRKVDRATVAVSKDLISEETDYYDEFVSTSSIFPSHTTTKIPFIASTMSNPTTTQIPVTTKQTYPTVHSRVHNNIIPSDKGLMFDTITIFTAKQGYSTPAPYSEEIHNSVYVLYNNVNGNKATTPNIAGLEPTTKPNTSKPRIVGGNAASFTVLFNSDAYLPCEAVGSPQPVITWKRFSSSTGTYTIQMFLRFLLYYFIFL